MSENIDGPGWEIVRPRPSWNRVSLTDIDHLVPDVTDFWHVLQRYCVPECCGLDAYSFDPAAVRWAAHLTDEVPDGFTEWRGDEVIDSAALAADLRRSAAEIRSLRVEAVTARLFNDVLAPEGYARLFESIAHALDPSDRA